MCNNQNCSFTVQIPFQSHGSWPAACWPESQRCQHVPQPPPAHVEPSCTWTGKSWPAPPVETLIFCLNRSKNNLILLRSFYLLLPQPASCKPSPSAAAYQQDPGVCNHSSYPPQSDAHFKLKEQHHVAFRYKTCIKMLMQ